MTDDYFIPGDQRAHKVHELFAAIAPRYDLINDVQSFGLHRRWKQRVVDLAHIRPGDRVLDVCCGTGDLALALARRGAEVIGLDFNEPMLTIARQRGQPSRRAKRNAENGNPLFLHGDAQQLPFADASFNIVTVGYGLRNLADWKAGLDEMVRVAKPGARLLVLDFGKPANALWRTVYFGYLRLFVPLLGLIFCRNAGAYGYILESLKHYPAQQGVAAHMRARGLTNVRIVNLLGGAMSINYGERAA
ncbi:MAG: bifunctional demethylmenaquinone methyltransferase/2-methoxy-6-polyprenyl-1,4-benzoquinol methylase UbiE [Verrucomicrobiae bacterium]|nr:bifunctional demethylmenaquinone methyltransferase/2-methoxy-6-polyprenyl-1,4-benzoquinol methylase UbiE [Verrucomicrobiae bacterium]